MNRLGFLRSSAGSVAAAAVASVVPLAGLVAPSADRVIIYGVPDLPEMLAYSEAVTKEIMMWTVLNVTFNGTPLVCDEPWRDGTRKLDDAAFIEIVTSADA